MGDRFTGHLIITYGIMPLNLQIMDYATEQITSSNSNYGRNNRGPPRQQNNSGYDQDYQRGDPSRSFRGRPPQQDSYRQPERGQYRENRQPNPNYQSQGNYSQNNWDHTRNQPSPNYQQSNNPPQYSYNGNRGRDYNSNRQEFNPNRNNFNQGRPDFRQQGNGFRGQQGMINDRQDSNRNQMGGGDADYYNDPVSSYPVRKDDSYPAQNDDSFGQGYPNSNYNGQVANPPNRQDNFRQNDFSRQRNNFQGGDPSFSQNNRYQGNQGSNNRYQGDQGRNNSFSPYNRRGGPRDGPRRRQEGGFQGYRQEPPKRELTEQDLINILMQKQLVDVENHRAIRLPSEATQPNPRSPYIVSSQKNQPVMVDLQTIESFRGVSRIAIPNTPARMSSFFSLPELQRMEEAEGVKGFKNATGIHFNEFERMGDELRAQILSRFDVNFRN